MLSGLSLSDNYQSASVVAERVIGQFQELLGTNSVRMPVNEPTILNAFDMYSGALDVALKHGRLVMGYWGPSQPSGPSNMENWWKMWAKLVEKYSDHPNAYFEIFNEPHMYNKDQLRNLYAEWLQKFPNVPRDHIILDGTGMAQNVPDIADDSRFDGCLFAVHEYTFWNMSITTEEGWKNSFKYKVGKYADRTVCTEWGGAMAPGDKAGVHYETMDYNSTPTNYFMAYIRGMSDQLREWQMGSFYWPGLRDGDWYSMTKRSGEGANIKLEVVNQSGLDRMHMAWSDTVETEPPLPPEPYLGEAVKLPGKIEAENYDKGSRGVAYSDKDSKNEGNVYREDGVDVVGLGCSDSLATKDCEGYAVGYTNAGEWMLYTVNVAKAGKFYVKANVASGLEGSSFRLFVDDEAVTDTVVIPRSVDSSWTTYSEVSAETKEIASGEHSLKLMITGSFANIDWIQFCETEQCEDPTGLRTSVPTVKRDSSPRLVKKGNTLFVEKNGQRFDLLGHRVKIK